MFTGIHASFDVSVAMRGCIVVNAESEHEIEILDDTEGDARAKMLCYLLENKLI